MTALLAATLLLVLAAPAFAVAPYRFRTLPVVADSGPHDGDASGPLVAWTTRVRAPGAAFVRVAVGAAQLGKGSWITFRSLEDGAEHRLDANSLDAWSRMSAILNGSEAEVSLHVAPGDEDVFVQLTGVAGSDRPPVIQTLCGTDDRVGSTDNRVGRITAVGCTAWRIGNGAFLTAGHCADIDPDSTGSQLPDGVLDWAAGTLVEFNVPASDSVGGMRASHPNDQYPIVLSSAQWMFGGDNAPLGNDWCVFRVNPSSNTGLLPHQAYGLPFRITREMPASSTQMRVTGFGTDTVPETNQTNQTSVGPLGTETLGTGTARFTHSVDSMGGNSGSPVIWEANQICVGIHTNGGCTSTGGANNGTSFENDALETAINNAPGANTIYVDSGNALQINQDGTLVRPIWTIGGGISTVVSGGRISVYPGTYGIPAGTVISKSMTIEAPVGTVTIAP